MLTENNKYLYKGYFVTTSSSGGNNPPYLASYGITKILPGGLAAPTEVIACTDNCQTEQEAHAAATVAARRHIDELTQKSNE